MAVASKNAPEIKRPKPSNASQKAKAGTKKIALLSRPRPIARPLKLPIKSESISITYVTLTNCVDWGSYGVITQQCIQHLKNFYAKSSPWDPITKNLGSELSKIL